MSDSMADAKAAAEATRAAQITELLKLKDATITRMVRNRIYVKHVGETLESPNSLCANCGGAFTQRGYCTNCGASR